VSPRRLRFGIKVAQMGGSFAEIRDAWLEADRLGFDTGWAHDHLLNQNDHTKSEDEGWTILTALLGRVRIEGLTLTVAPIVNDWFGRDIGVAGLLTGEDIQAQLAGRALGDEVLVPAVAVRDAGDVFLDDLTPVDVAAALGVAVRTVEPSASALLAAALGR